MAAKKKETTKKPSGLTITRDGNKYIFAWKKGETYSDGQQLYYSYTYTYGDAGGMYQSDLIKLGSGASKKSVTISAKYLEKINFGIRGKAKDTSKVIHPWSDWVDTSFKVNAPKVKASVSWDSSYPNKSTFRYEVTQGPHKPYTKCVYQTIRLKDCPSNYKAEKFWESATNHDLTGTSGTFQTAAESGLSGSMTRIVRVRAIGQGGKSEWSYAYHVYAAPNKPKITKATASYKASQGWFDTLIKWSLAENKLQHPVDKTVIEAQVGIPSSGQGLPSNGSWDEIDTPKNTSGNIWQGKIEKQLEEDECLFVRVKAIHDANSNANASDFRIAAEAKLKAPTAISATSDQSTHTFSVNVTNACQNPDAKLAIVYREKNRQGVFAVVSASTAMPVSVVVPSWTGTAGTIGAYAFVGSNDTPQADTSGVRIYAVDEILRSDIKWGSGVYTPVVEVAQHDEETALVEWTWPDSGAKQAEISWSDNPNAWESNEQPSTYTVDNYHAAKWYISNLDAGKIYYFRVRFLNGDGDTLVYGAYSPQVSLDLSSAPDAPVLSIEDTFLAVGESTTASWIYVTTDGTPQQSAEIAEMVNGSPEKIIDVGEESYTDITAEGWGEGTQHDIAVRVYSKSNRESAWSNTVTVTVADPLTCEIAASSIKDDQSVPIDTGTITENILDELPLTVTVTGAGTSATTILKIVRAENYYMERPDEKNYAGYENEVILHLEQTGEAEMTITRSDLDRVNGRLDDGARYRIEAAVTDRFGQRAESDPKDFTVRWSHQAVKAEGTAAISEVNDEIVGLITPIEPADVPQSWELEEGDRIDIYRLSADAPELLVKGADFGETYVDPYPTLGDMGGYRLVFITSNGDYIIGEDEPSWLDIQTDYETQEQFIDFEGKTIALSHNVELEESSDKAFEVTHYLGGSIQGDWLEGVEGKGSINGFVLPELDPEMYRLLRELKRYTGLCRVRTKTGSNYTADITVQDSVSYDTAGRIHEVQLNITQVDNPVSVGMLLTDWDPNAVTGATGEES